MTYTIQEFIDRIRDAAQVNMKKTGVLASLTIAQGILESGYGNSQLAEAANNLFGMKGEYKGKSIIINTLQYSKRKPYSREVKYRKYSSWQESIDDHTDIFLQNSPYQGVIGENDYIEACRKIYEAGYTTNADYVNKLIEIIEKYQLYEYDVLDDKEAVVDFNVVQKTVIQLNGVEKEVETIFKDGRNYIKLRDLADSRILVDYDVDKKLPIVQIIDEKVENQ